MCSAHQWQPGLPPHVATGHDKPHTRLNLQGLRLFCPCVALLQPAERLTEHHSCTMWEDLKERYFRGYGFSKNVERQTSCVKRAAEQGFTWGFGGLAASTVAVLGACKAFPRFERSLSVSSKTALIVMPFFALFFLQAELTLNQCHKDQIYQRALAAGLIKPEQES